MPLLFNSTTNAPEILPETEIQNAILKGTHFYDAKERINVRDQQGKTFDLPSNQLLTALQNGFSLETATQGAVREYVKDNKGIKGAIKVGLGQFADEALMGIPETAYDLTADPLEVAKKEALKKDHQLANAIGGIGGFGASLAVGGPLFKGATTVGKAAERVVAAKLGEYGIEQGAKGIAKSLTSKMINNATRLGVESAVVSAPQAVTEAALGDPELAAESILTNVGIGAFLGVMGPGAKELIKLGNTVVSKGADLVTKGTNAGRAALSVSGVSPAAQAKLVRKFPEIMDELPDFYRNKVGLKVTDASSEKVLAKVEKAVDDAGETIGNITKNVQGDIDLSPYMNEAFENLQKDLIDPISGLPLSGKRVKEAEEAMLEILGQIPEYNPSMAKTVPISDLQRRKVGIKNLIDLDKDPLKRTIQEDALSELRTAYKKAQEAGVESNSPELLEQLKVANRTYQIGSEILPHLEKKAAKQGLHDLVGLKDLVGVGVGSVFGPVGVAVGLATSPITKPYRENLAVLYGEQALKKVGQKLDAIPEYVNKLISKLPQKAEISSVGAIGRLLGTTETDRKKQLEDFRDKVDELSANPEMMTNQFSYLTRGLEGTPNISSALAAKNAMILQYLQNTIPKAKGPPTPFNKMKWEPSPSELSKFERRVHALNNPLTVLDELKAGTVTKESIESLQVGHPKLFEAMKKRVLSSLEQNDKPVPYAARIKLSLLFEEPFDGNLNSQVITNYQLNFKKQDQGDPNAAIQANLNLPDSQSNIDRVATS